MRVIAPFKQRGRARRKTFRRGRRRTQGHSGTGGTEKAAAVRICPAPQKGMTGRQENFPRRKKIKRGPAGKASVYYSFSRGTRQLLSCQDVRQERQQKAPPFPSERGDAQDVEQSAFPPCHCGKETLPLPVCKGIVHTMQTNLAGYQRVSYGPGDRHCGS